MTSDRRFVAGLLVGVLVTVLAVVTVAAVSRAVDADDGAPVGVSAGPAEPDAGRGTSSGEDAADVPPGSPIDPGSGGGTPAGTEGGAAEEGCPRATTEVSTADELEQALQDARPGDVLLLADGTYEGRFVAEGSGTAERPIVLCGSAEAVLDGGDVEEGYVLHLDHASHWRLVGFTVTNGQKGVMADGTSGTVVQGLTVHHIGDEAIHLRRHSTDNVVQDNVIRDTGNRREKFGEGVYIGSAESNWCDLTDCEPDRSDRNAVLRNTISDTTSESVDIKEGTTGGVVQDNVFDGSAMTEADSWVDVKGNEWLVQGNTGTSSPEDGFQTHDVVRGWGDRNVFRGNSGRVDGPGLGIALRPELSNVVTCDNQITGAAEGLSNIDCTYP